MIFSASVFFVFAAIAFSQGKFEFGVRADAPIIGPVTATSYPMLCANGAQCGYFEIAPYHPAVGLSASIPIARRLRLRLRFDPEYQRIGISASSYGFVYLAGPGSAMGEDIFRTSTAANRWQFPLLFETGIARHYRIGVGPAVSLVSGAQATAVNLNPFFPEVNVPGQYSPPIDRHAIGGAAAAIEFPFRFGHVTLAPELRYKRWFDKHFGGNSRLDEFTGGLAIRFSR